MNGTNTPAFSFTNIGHGSIVKLKKELMGQPVGTYGYVYQQYSGGVSVITENGVDVGGFTEGEQLIYLEYVRDSWYQYKFSNVIKLARDFESQIKPVFL